MRGVLVPALAVAVLVACGSTPEAEPAPDGQLFLPAAGARPAPVVVGLAGAYDVRAIARISQDLFGVPEQEDPDLWREGDVLAWAGERPDLPVLLVHGDADAVVPLKELAS